ncbi:MAG: TIGR04211 family SH3 domain-containing protein [Deltaproteobacteria bacterium]|nr:TIGR04211 family SH3 domain-containing protein [Deltaproteobacteria bacterium]
MRYAILIGIWLVVFPAAISAETQYVTPVREITLRTGPGSGYKIIAMLRSGTSVDVRETDNEWSKVLLENGKEGWVMIQYLQMDLPVGIALERLKKAHQQLKKEATLLRSDTKRLKSENKTFQADLTKKTTGINTLQTDFDKLKKESADFLKLKSNYEKSTAQLSKERSRADQLAEELSLLYEDKRITWFIVGAGVLLLGLIIGFASRRSQRPRSSLR